MDGRQPTSEEAREFWNSLGAESRAVLLDHHVVGGELAFRLLESGMVFHTGGPLGERSIVLSPEGTGPPGTPQASDGGGFVYATELARILDRGTLEDA